MNTKLRLSGMFIFILLIIIPPNAFGEFNTTDRLGEIEHDLTPTTRVSHSRSHTLNVSTDANSVELQEIRLTELYHTFVQISLDEGKSEDGFSSILYRIELSLYPFTTHVPSILTMAEEDIRIGDVVNMGFGADQSIGMKEILLTKQELPIIPKILITSSSNRLAELTFTVSIQVYAHIRDTDRVIDQIQNGAVLDFKTIAFPRSFNFSQTDFVQETQNLYVFLPREILPSNIEGMNLTEYFLDLTMIFSSNRGLEESFDDFLDIQANGKPLQLDSTLAGDYYYSAYIPIADIIEITIAHTGDARSIEVLGIIGANDQVYRNRESRSLTIPEIVGTLLFVLMVSYLSMKMPIMFERRKFVEKQEKNRKKIRVSKKSIRS